MGAPARQPNQTHLQPKSQPDPQVVVADVLRGSPPEACNGLICLITGIDGGPLLDRRLLLAVISLGVAAPLLLLRPMRSLDALNGLGMAAALLVAGVAAVLGISAVAQGTAHPLPWLSALTKPHNHSGAGAAAHASNLAGVVAVVLTSFVGQQSLHPAMPLLQPYAPARMVAACAAALSASLTIYLVLAIGAGLAFGAATRSDVLLNFSVAAMSRLLGGRAAAVAASVAVQASYAVTVMSSFALFVHPLRTAIAELLFDRSTGSSGGGQGALTAEEAVEEGRQQAAVVTAVAAGAASTSSGDTEAVALLGVDKALDKAAAGGSDDATGSSSDRVKAMEARHYVKLTYGILAVVTLTAVCVPGE
jgi:hypothetical protein